MQDYFERIKIEHVDLCLKIDKLEKFFQHDKFPQLTDFHKSLLVMQHVYMCQYCNVLAQRILDLQHEQNKE